jgi:hypothetical protein
MAQRGNVRAQLGVGVSPARQPWRRAATAADGTLAALPGGAEAARLTHAAPCTRLRAVRSG